MAVRGGAQRSWRLWQSSKTPGFMFTGFTSAKTHAGAAAIVRFLDTRIGKFPPSPSVPHQPIVYNPEFVSFSGVFPEKKTAVDQGIEAWSAVLDLTFLRVHARFNQFVKRIDQDAEILTLSTSVSRNDGRQIAPFMFDTTFYAYNPHPYDAESYLPGYFINGCVRVLEQLLMKVWGHDVLEGLVCEREVLMQMFIRILHQHGLNPEEVNFAWELSEIREQLEVYLLSSDNKTPKELLKIILLDHRGWRLTKSIEEIIVNGNESFEDKLHANENVEKFLDQILEDLLSTRLFERLDRIGRELLKYEVPKNLKKEYEKALSIAIRSSLMHDDATLDEELLEYNPGTILNRQEASDKDFGKSSRSYRNMNIVLQTIPYEERPRYDSKERE